MGGGGGYPGCSRILAPSTIFPIGIHNVSLFLVLSHTDALGLIRIELPWQRGAKIKSSPWPTIYIKLVGTCYL